MLRIKLAIVSTALASVLVLGLEAQQADKTAPAPLPSQIMTAKKVFISNAGGEFDPAMWSGESTRTYDQFYAAIKSWGRYEIVGAPADADLVLEIGFANPIVGIMVSSTLGGRSSNDPQFRLVMLDPQTHILLWTLTAHVPQKIGLQKSRDRNFDESLARLVDRLKKITTQSTAAVVGPPK
jgi:hypothetical protein